MIRRPLWGLSLASVVLWLCGCSPPDVAAVDVTVANKRLPDDGTVTVVNVIAVDGYNEPGKGSVRVQSSAGSLVDGVTLQLDARGRASVDFTCSVKEDPGCSGTVTITAEWLFIGQIIRDETTLELVFSDAVTAACGPGRARTLTVHRSTTADIALATRLTGAEVKTVGTEGSERGLALFDATTGVAVVAVRRAAGAGIAEEQRQALNALATVGALGNVLETTYTSWDLNPAVRSAFEYDGADSTRARIDAVAAALVGTPSGLTAGTTVGPFRGVMTVVRRSTATIVVVGIVPQTRYNAASIAVLEDLAGGSALAAAADSLSDSGCESFDVTVGAKVDLVWVVDDSGSMESSQVAVAQVGGQVAARLGGAGLDLRIAGVSTGYYPTGFDGSIRAWTTSLDVMLSWFGSGSSSWGTVGDGDERGFEGFQSFANGLFKQGATVIPSAVRPDADLHLLFLTDAPEQSSIAPAQMLTFLAQKYPGQRVVAHGVICPEGENCGDSDEDTVGKYHTLVRSTKGVLGSILTFNASPTPALQAQQADTMRAIVRSIIAGAGYRLSGFPIAASMRVAVSSTKGACDNIDVPRSEEQGFQVDTAERRLAFAGLCAPPLGAKVALSYLVWTH